MIDTDGGDELRSIKDELDERRVRLAISRLNFEGKGALRSNDVYDRIGDDMFFPTVDGAVRALTAAAQRDGN